ncbi:unnamed protein product [[Candida] boidinii]|uniref:Unnamed protein product n=1 Tax=Candida boidinii TaxID=5477 RepID=A0A9W6W9C2_CANBO|nr:hypothetical protein BVG19_g3550 [[Candida] boidinii]OWB48945.1 hypothetical protein B5S27_g483 [[Candida] boidinii]OWB67519.1 hypothetical protein B5S30_g2880 [[Candida] boidinii]OWB84900.1 hypothetical protein B5S33_g3557 [[Candida] boidinii]GME69578.1 unnamed protein product [[Candida] boidinii]
MSILSLSGWALFGAAARAFQQGIRQAPLLHYPLAFGYSAGFWVGFGYLFESWVDNNNKLLERRVEKLKEARAARA